MKLSVLVEELNNLIQQGLGDREVVVHTCLNDQRATLDNFEQDGQYIVLNVWEM